MNGFETYHVKRRIEGLFKRGIRDPEEIAFISGSDIGFVLKVLGLEAGRNKNGENFTENGNKNTKSS